jgi:hypothetical protein
MRSIPFGIFSDDRVISKDTGFALVLWVRQDTQKPSYYVIYIWFIIINKIIICDNISLVVLSDMR